MKIHKRFAAPSLARPLAAATSSSAPSSSSVSSRVRSSSVSCISTASSSGTVGSTVPPGARSLYTAASSSSLPFGFFDTPPGVNVSPAPPTSVRPGSSSSNLIVSTRLAAEVKAELEPPSQSQHQQQSNGSSAPHQHGNSSSSGSSGGGPPPYSLVFSSTNNQPDVSNLSGHHLQAHYQLLFPNYGHLPFGAVHPYADGSVSAASDGILTKTGNKRQRLRYHLDVGAYGIPKHSRKAGAVAGRDGFTVGGMGAKKDRLEAPGVGENIKPLAVQVGEDAYFIRENAMGVADGVGGWAKARARGKSPTTFDDPSPSALFAHRLMHYCCEEVEAAIGARSASLAPELDRLAEENLYSSDAHMSNAADLHDQLDDSLEELADGLDVLQILEKAFEKTMRAHVVVPDVESSPNEADSVFTPSTSSGQDGSTVPEQTTHHAAGEMSAAVATDTTDQGSMSVDEHTSSHPTLENSTARVDDGQPQAFDSKSRLARTGTHLSDDSAQFGSRPTSTSGTSSSSRPSSGAYASSETASGSTTHPSRTPIPLMEGSSTALLAVLEHAPLPSSPPLSLAHSLSRSPSPSSVSDDPSAIGNFLPRAPSASKGRGTGLVLLNPQARRLLERGTPAYPVPPPAFVSRARDVGRTAGSEAEEDVAKEDRPVSGGAVLRIAHLGDCMAMLVRGEEVVWRTDEMWWNFNTPVQLGPSSPTRPSDAKTFSIPVQEDDILILASDGLSDNLWDEDIVDEVIRFRRSFMTTSPASPASSHKSSDSSDSAANASLNSRGILGRGTLAGMLSEALCSRARCVSERRPQTYSRRRGGAAKVSPGADIGTEDDIPFGRRAREEGRWFAGGKLDDISVLVAVVSPVE